MHWKQKQVNGFVVMFDVLVFGRNLLVRSRGDWQKLIDILLRRVTLQSAIPENTRILNQFNPRICSRKGKPTNSLLHSSIKSVSVLEILINKQHPENRNSV